VGALLWVGMGCSGEAPLQPADFPSAFVRATCQRAQECCVADASTKDRERQMDCEVNREFVAALMGDLGQAVDEQRVAYNPEMAARCLVAIRSTSCGPFIDVTRTDVANMDCAWAVRGLISMDGSCLSGWDCAPGLFCDRGPIAGQQRCTARRQEGTACARDDQCATGHCRDKRCQPAPAMCVGY
jgi:hypothetical protein